MSTRKLTAWFGFVSYSSKIFSNDYVDANKKVSFRMLISLKIIFMTLIFHILKPTTLF